MNSKTMIKFKNRISRLIPLSLLAILAAATAGCDDNKSYAERLTEENHAVNLFLSDQRVIDHVPADSVFESGEDAPYYCIDSENSIYMKVLSAGSGERALEGQKIYFRYLQAPLNTYNGVIYDDEWIGNASQVTGKPTYFKFDDFADQSSQVWGTGIQQPLHFLPLNCHVLLVVKSQYGPTQSIANVVPYIWDLRYFKSQI